MRNQASCKCSQEPNQAAGKFDKAVTTCVEAAKLARTKELGASIDAMQRQLEQRQSYCQFR
jgi:hypothetical protein